MAPMAAHRLLEICIDSVLGAIAAEQGGADRVELCANLLEGGTTPSLGMVRAVLAATRLPVMVMIRPRGGHFCYDAHEIDVMRRDIEILAQERVHGFVIGALTIDGTLDEATCLDLIARVPHRSITFHRAFDQVADPQIALAKLIDWRVDRILTSGLAPSAWEGRDVIRMLIEWSGGRISIMPGCGVRPDNIAMLLEATGAHEVHGSASRVRETPVAFWRQDVPMHAAAPLPDDQRRITCTEHVQAMHAALVHRPKNH